MKTAFQIDDHGNHRVVVDDIAGEWTGYNHVSRLTIGQNTYVGFTAYWEGSLPIEQVLRVEKVNRGTFEIVSGTRPEFVPA